MFAVYNQGIADTAMLTVCNLGKYLDWQLHISLAKVCGQKFVQPLKTMIYVVVLGREAIFVFYIVEVAKGR